MKILAAGDIHGDIEQAEKLAEQAEKENVDIVIISGDLTFSEINTQGLLSPFKKKNKKVLIIPGNHESIATTDALAQVYGAVNLHGYYFTSEDIGIFGAGSANIGIFQLEEKELYDLLKRSFDKIKTKQKTIMVTHVHPEGSLMSKMTQFVPGSTAVADAIQKFQPDIAICSHVHEAEGIEERVGKTRLISVGKQGKIIEI